VIRGYLPGEPRCLSADEVLTLHETAIHAFAGAHGLRDADLLDSANATARQGFGGEFVHEFLFGLAAAYLFHLCANHPFVDANKRTALAACITFLRLNNWNLVATEDAAVAMVLEVTQSTLSKEEVACWLQDNSIPHYHSAIVNEGVGAFSFISPTRTFVNRSDAVVGFSQAVPLGSDPFNRPEAVNFLPWDMLISIGPISSTGRLLQWNDSSDVITSGGIQTFLDRNSPATFTATIIPEPSGFVLLASLLFFLLSRTKHA
jgi:death-on-curing protein